MVRLISQHVFFHCSHECHLWQLTGTHCCYVIHTEIYKDAVQMH